MHCVRKGVPVLEVHVEVVLAVVGRVSKLRFQFQHASLQLVVVGLQQLAEHVVMHRQDNQNKQSKQEMNEGEARTSCD